MQIPSRQPTACHVELASHADGHRGQRFVQDMDAQIRNVAADLASASHPGALAIERLVN